MAGYHGQIERIEQRLLRAPERPVDFESLVPEWKPDIVHSRPPVDAAVLIALVGRGENLSVLYTERSSKLRSHSGQVSFPGGKLDPDDDGPAEAALREAAEEIALRPSDARVLGFMPRVFTGTNYLITPVVALVEPQSDFVANPQEVHSIFEVPFEDILREQTYGKHKITWKGGEHSTWQIMYPDKLIWGITANLTRQFYELALRESAVE